MSAAFQQKTQATEQLTTFYVDGDLFGIEVMKVQEVAGRPNLFEVPLAPRFVKGLVNLRGQIATALELREIYAKPQKQDQQQMSVICKIDGNLVSLLVDSIGDVVEVNSSDFESVPDTIPLQVRRFIKGIYKMNGTLLSVLDLEALAKELSPDNETTTNLNN